MTLLFRSPGSRTHQLSIAGAVVALALYSASTSAAKGPTEAEIAAGNACLRQVCNVIATGGTAPDKVRCDLSREWSRLEIQEALKEKIRLDWPLGSAFCRVDVDVAAEHFTDAVAPGTQKFVVPPQPVNCELKRGEKTYPVSFTLSPTLTMKDGRSTTATIGIADIKGPTALKALLWSISKLEQAYNPFQSDIVRSVNGFLQHGCKTSD